MRGLLFRILLSYSFTSEELKKNFEITEELLSMESLKGTVTGIDVYNSAINSLIRSGF